MAGAIAKAGELAEEIDGAVVLGQFINKANPAAHTASTDRRYGKIPKVRWISSLRESVPVEQLQEPGSI